MGTLDEKRIRQRGGRVLLVWLCVLLVTFCGTLQAVHTHPNGDALHADCSLCATAHVAPQVVQSPVPAPAVAVFAVLEVQPQTIAPAAPSTFALFTRPPPAVVAAA